MEPNTNLLTETTECKFEVPFIILSSQVVWRCMELLIHGFLQLNYHDPMLHLQQVVVKEISSRTLSVWSRCQKAAAEEGKIKGQLHYGGQISTPEPPVSLYNTDITCWCLFIMSRIRCLDHPFDKVVIYIHFTLSCSMACVLL